MLSDRVVVPQKLRERILKTLHLGHPGVVRIKALARLHVFWPGLDKDIERAVCQCSSCAAYAKEPIKADLTPREPEVKPWNRIHLDFAGPFYNEMFLIIVDACSRWPEVMKTVTTEDSNV